MKTLLHILIVLIAFSSCSPIKRLERFYDRHPDLKPQSSVEIKTEYDTLVVYRDTVIYKDLPADTIIKKIIVSDSTTTPVIPKFSSDTLTAETKRSKASTWVYKGELGLMLTDKDTTIEIRLEKAIKEAHYWKDKYEKETVVVKTAVVPKIVKFFMWLGIILFVLLIVLIIRNIPKIKDVLKWFTKTNK